MTSPALRREVLETFVPLNALPVERLEYLLHDVTVMTLNPGDVLEDCREGSGQTVYLLSGNLLFSDESGEVARICAGEVQSWYPVTTPRGGRQTVRAETTVNCICLESERLDRVLAWEQSARYFEAELAFEQGLEDSRWLRRLLRAPIFYHLPAAHVREMFHRMVPRKVEAGEAVVIEGELADACYFIKQGVAEVVVGLPDGGQRCLALLEPGKYFGEEGLLFSGRRNATVRMETNGELLRLEKLDFDELIKAPVVAVVDAHEAMERIQAGGQWLDVRLVDEYRGEGLPGAVSVPLQSLRIKGRLLEKSRHYVICCDTGRRSAAAAFILCGEGYDCSVLDGGLNSLGETDFQTIMQGQN